MKDSRHEPSRGRGRLVKRIEIIRKQLDEMPEWEKKLIGYGEQKVKNVE